MAVTTRSSSAAARSGGDSGAAHAAAATPSKQQQEPGSGGDDAVVGATLAAWRKQYPLPDEAAGSLPEARLLYKPPRSDAKGLAVAAAVITSWALLFWHALWGIHLGDDTSPGAPPRSPWWDVVGTFFALEFAAAGLFITTHDAMHGAVCFRSRRLNDLVGRLAISLYAMFDYDMLHRKHWEHHGATGQTGADPDFHGGRAALLPWFGRFMAAYTTAGQLLRMVAWTTALQALGARYLNLVVFFAGAHLLAAFRLFYFGTYLPHLPRTDDEQMPWHRSHSYDGGGWAAFLQCYCFGYHFEHHRWPYAPWWDLWRCKALTRRLRAEGKFVPPPPGVARLLF